MIGWELVAGSEHGAALWDALMVTGTEHGLIAAGSAALSSLRIEKGYRMRGTDMTPEHAPAEAGLGFAVRTDGSDFLGRDGLAVRPAATRRLACLTMEPGLVMTGGEPVFAGDEVIGYVTSAAYGPSVERSIAFAWMPSELESHDPVFVGSFDRRVEAAMVETPLFDPGGARIRA